MHRSMFKSIVTYGFEDRPFNKNDEPYLNILDKKILRRIFGPENEEWGKIFIIEKRYTTQI